MLGAARASEYAGWWSGNVTRSVTMTSASTFNYTLYQDPNFAWENDSVTTGVGGVSTGSINLAIRNFPINVSNRRMGSSSRADSPAQSISPATYRCRSTSWFNQPGANPVSSIVSGDRGRPTGGFGLGRAPARSSSVISMYQHLSSPALAEQIEISSERESCDPGCNGKRHRQARRWREERFGLMTAQIARSHQWPSHPASDTRSR